MQCPKCNIEIPEGFENCPNCNTNIYETENVMPCPRCYKRIDKSAKFCPFCGEKIVGSTTDNIKIDDTKNNFSSNNNSSSTYTYEVDSPFKKYENWLKDEDKFITIKDEDFVFENCTVTVLCWIGGFLGAIWAFAVNNTEGFFFSIVLVFKVIVGVIVMGIIGGTITTPSELEHEKKVKSLKGKILAHNDKVFENYKKERLVFYNIKKISKEIMIYACRNEYTGVLIDDENKMFSYVSVSMSSKTGVKSCTVHQSNYSEILRYSFLDKSTSTQVATSTTSSNSGKALGGAIASQVLIGNATAGAVIGGSGQRTTETTYKTKVINKYQITIYLNRLQDSVLTINLTSGNTTNEIISTLEYILNTNKG